MKTERTAKLPPFYTHVIGSLPRPKAVLDLLARRESLSAERFEKLMDEMIVFAIRLQERAGIDVVSDGEWRRSQYIEEFLERLGGFPKVRQYEHQGEKKTTRVIEETLIRRALQKTKGNRTRAAEVLELSHRALLYKIKDYKITDL